MASIAEITQTKGWKNFMAKLYGWGAAVVILGAMFKIMHWPGAGIMLVLGLSTEAVIFFFSAFEPPHEETDWSLVYPELAGMHGEESEEAVEADERSLTERLDAMMEEARIEPEMIGRLGAGLEKMGTAAGQIGELSEAASATSEYVANVKTAASNVSELSASYSRASESLNSLAGSADDSQNYAQEVKKVSSSLTELNEIYQKQISDSNNQLAASTKFNASVEELMQSLNDSLDDTKRFKSEVAKLSDNLSSLNTVYGNMLTAMNVNR